MTKKELQEQIDKLNDHIKSLENRIKALELDKVTIPYVSPYVEPYKTTPTTPWQQPIIWYSVASDNQCVAIEVVGV